MMCARCVSAVRTEMKSILAISWFVCPSARSRSTSRSRSESGSASARRLLGLGGDDPRAERRVDVAPAAGDLAHRGDDLGVGRLLEDVAARARRERLADVARVVLHREDEHLRVRRLLEHVGGRLDPALSGMTTSIRTTSGLAMARLEDRLAASPASPTDLEVASASRSRRRPVRTTAWSSTIRTRIVTRRHLDDDRRSRLSDDSIWSVPSTSATRSRMPTRPSPPPSSLRREAAAVVLDHRATDARLA